MKKVYATYLMLAVAVSVTMAQSSVQLPDKDVNTSKFADRPTENVSTRGGGGLNCPTTEDFESGFPGTWTNETTNANQNWVYMTTGGNPTGHMNIQYDDALGQQDESLITGPINLALIPNAGLYFDWFASYFWAVSPNDNYDLTVSISTDGGTNWTDLWTETDAGEFNSYEWYTQVLDLNAYALVTDALFKFNYYGADGAQAKLDNINFCTLPANDLRLDVVYTGDVITDYIYTRLPLSQAVEIVAGAVANNFGIAPQSNLSYDWEITLDGNSVASGTAAGAAALAPGAVDTVWVSTGYTPDATGEIVVSFEVSATESEEIPEDNVLSDNLLITDFVWGHDYDDEDYFGYGYAGDDPNGSGGFEVGARYFCQNDGDFIYSLQFPLSSSTTSLSVTAKVYEDATTNGSVSETIYDIQQGDLSPSGGVNFITIVLDDPVEMLTGSVYTATVAIEAGDDGYILGNNIDDNDNGQAVYFVNDDTWYNWVGLTTAMRVSLDGTVGIEENRDVSGVYILPNPATENLTVGFVSEGDQNVSVNLIAANGSLIRSEQVTAKVGQSNMVTFEVEGLSAGIYMVQLQGSNSSLTQRVVVQ